MLEIESIIVNLSGTFISFRQVQARNLKCDTTARLTKFYYMPLIYDFVIKRNKINCIFLSIYFFTIQNVQMCDLNIELKDRS